MFLHSRIILGFRKGSNAQTFIFVASDIRDRLNLLILSSSSSLAAINSHHAREDIKTFVGHVMHVSHNRNHMNLFR